MTTAKAIEPATVNDLPAILQLLSDAGLPTGGVEEQFPGAFAVIREGARLLAVAGVESYAGVGLLRSVAVVGNAQRRYLATNLVEERLRFAIDQGLSAVYLLTPNAEAFFHRFGFTATARAEVPPELAGSTEFAALCPASAICLVKQLPMLSLKMKLAIFACVHSAGRSQMASAWFNELADPALSRAIAAGTQPADHVHPVVIEVMKEVSIDLSSAKPQLLTAELVSAASCLTTMGCGEQCPVVPRNVRRQDWALDDPKGKPIAEVRTIRDEIRRRVEQLLRDEQWARQS